MPDLENKKAKSKVAQREEKTLAFWRENKIFEKSLANPPAGGAPNGEFVFYDGPPFATGLPHYGHILPGTVKDIIPRYKTMRGYRVPRVWGWDCHGLPIENLVEKELDLETKKDIEKFGVDKFNEKARASVLRYEKEWKEIIPRTGRWIDLEHAYKTMDATYTESVWWAFKNLYEKNLIYQGFKSMHLCPRCETTLSNFEVSQGYKNITDISVYVKFELVDEPGTFLLAWTTTPWTLPGNAAVAINPNIKYQKVKKEEEKYILAANLAGKVLKENYEVLEEISGAELVGKKYKSLFPYYQTEGQIYAADFVSTEEGTGIVHIAPAFGEEDYQLSLRENLPLIQHVGTDGRFKPEVTDFAGEQVKPKDPSTGSGQAHQATDIKIIKYLAGKNLLFAKEKITHSYPHCWRCDTPLLNYASSSWFLKVTDEKLKAKIIAENQNVSWIPEDIRDGRFGKWLEGARDWAISRSRYWGTPLPVWVCDECKTKKVIGSLEELKNLAPKSGNRYFVMRHGEAEHNVKHVLSTKVGNQHHLTKIGEEQAVEASRKLESEKIDLIIASDFIRTRETAKILQEQLGLKPEQVILDEHLRELNVGGFDDQPDSVDWHDRPGVETWLDIRRRVMKMLYEIDSEYQDKRILLITHDVPARALTNSEKVFGLSEYREFDFSPLPHNADYELDLHRPHIDEVKFACEKCNSEMKRVPEILDTWYDSGSVPFASQNLRESQPADFIAEGLDQTRGWFYTLIVLGTALFGKSPYKKVVVNGLILAEDGKKMSKRLKNYPELTDVLDKYGADALRYYLVASPAVRAEDLAFSEKGLNEVVKKIILRLENVLSFYELYKNDAGSQKTGANILDTWILARLAELNQEVTDGLENYELDKAARPFALFVDDLSTWYLRRSRERLRGEGMSVLENVLRELAKLLAPFMPFIAEDIWGKLKRESDSESVHLERWPDSQKFDVNILTEMAKVRRIVSLGLEERAKTGIKVRQPLGLLKIKTNLSTDYLELILEEVNIKQINVSEEMVNEIELDTKLTPELREEGDLRDLVRLIQDERKKIKLKPGELANLTLNPNYQNLVKKFEADLKKTCALVSINFDSQCPILSITPKA